MSVRPYVPECIVCACKHATVRVCACARALLRKCESVRPSVHPSVSPSVCLSVCLSACMFVRPNVWSYKPAFINACIRVFACTRTWGRMLESVRPSICPRACSCVQMFVRTCVRSSMHAWHFLFLTSNFLLLTSNFLLLTSNFHVCTWVFASVRTCVRMALRPCVCTWVHRVYV